MLRQQNKYSVAIETSLLSLQYETCFYGGSKNTPNVLLDMKGIK
jgi:hypothetical protein